MRRAEGLERLVGNVSRRNRCEAGGAEALGVADHERQRAEHLGAIAERSCFHLDVAAAPGIA